MLLAIAAAAGMGALVWANPVTAAAAPGDSSGGDASGQPIPMVPIGPIQGEAVPDLKVPAPQKPAGAIPPGTVLNQSTLTAANMPQATPTQPQAPVAPKRPAFSQGPGWAGLDGDCVPGLCVTGVGSEFQGRPR